MSARAVAYPAEIELQELNSKPAELLPPDRTAPSRDLPSEKRRVLHNRYYASVARHYSGLMGNMVQDIDLLKDVGDDVVYLIDEDVIRNVVEQRYKDPRLQLEAERLFTSASVRFSIPLGAFHELVAWLSRFALPGATLWDRRPIDYLESLRDLKELAKSLGVDADGSALELASRVASSLQTSRLRIERLIGFLSKCENVEKDYDENDRVKIERIIQAVPREDRPKDGTTSDSDEEPRDMRDRRDAINLAIVFKRFRQAKTSATGEGEAAFILVSETRALRNLAKNTREYLDHWAMKDLADLLGLTSLGMSNYIVTDEMCPVLTPRRAFTVEEFRKLNTFNDDATAELSRLRQEYDELADVLRSEADESDNDDAVRRSAEIEAQIRSRLDRLEIVYERGMFYRRLEEDRATVASVLYLQEKYKPGSVSSREQAEMLGVEAESFLKALRRAYTELERKSVTSYFPSLREEGAKLASFQILAERWSGEANVVDVVVEGELYRSPEMMAAGAYKSYSVRWPTSCTDREFFGAVSGVVRFADRMGSAPEALRLHPLSNYERVRSGGVVVFTNVGAFGAAFQELPSALTLSGIRLKKLYEAIATGDKEVEVEALRVCTPFGDFQVDIRPNDSGRREMFVISRHNIGQQIVHLCSRTSLSVVLPLKLNEALQQQVTRHFPVFENVGAA